MGNKRFTRCMSNKMIAGVCSGIANYFGWDVSIVRIVYSILTLCTAFCGGIVYIILWLVVPKDQ